MSEQSLSVVEQAIINELMSEFDITDPSDSRVAAWGPPFSDDTLAEMLSISFNKNFDIRSDGFELISRCRTIILFSAHDCEFYDLDFLRDLQQLEKVRVIYTPLKDISALREMPLIEMAAFENCLIEDISPLMDLEHLDRLDLRGNPLTEHSYYELLPILRQRFDDAGRLKYFEVSDEENWRWSRELCDRGIRACAFRAREGGMMICFPGLTITDDPSWTGSWDISPEELRSLLADPNMTTEKLFAYKRSPERMAKIKHDLNEMIRNAPGRPTDS